MAIRNVPKTFTFEQQRQQINLLAQDVGDVSSLQGGTSLVTAINDIAQNFVGPVNQLQLVTVGTGYSATGTNVATTSNGNGTNLVVSWTGGSGGALPNTLTITNPGDGYKVGDTVTIGGGTGGVFEVMSLTSSTVSVSASDAQKIAIGVSTQTTNKPLAILDGTTSPASIEYDSNLTYKADTDTLNASNIISTSQVLSAGTTSSKSLLFKNTAGTSDNTGFYRDNTGIIIQSGTTSNKITFTSDGRIIAAGLESTNSSNVELTNNERTIYVSKNELYADDSFTATGRSLNKPFKSIERALFEVAKQSYIAGSGQLGEVPANKITSGKVYKIKVAGNTNWTSIGSSSSTVGTQFTATGTATGTGIAEEVGVDNFEYYTIVVYPGDYDIDNRPGKQKSAGDFATFFTTAANFDTTQELVDNLYQLNPPSGGLIVPRGTSIIGLDLRKTIIRPKYVPDPATPPTPHRYQDAANLIFSNRDYIQSESFGWLQDNFTTGNTDYNKALCKRDIGYFIDALVYDLKNGGNSKTFDSAKYYYQNNVLAYINGTNEKTDTINTLRISAHQAVMAIRNSSFTAIATTSSSTITFQTAQQGISPGVVVTGAGITGNRTITAVTYNASGLATSATLSAAVNTNQSTNTSFVFTAGSYYSVKSPYKEAKFNSAPLVDSSSPECSNVSSSIFTLYNLFVDILNDNITTTSRTVPFGYDRDQETALFRVTGGSYFWQLTIKDAINVPQYVNSSGSLVTFANQNGVDDTGCFPCSHHKLVAFKYANAEELDEYYLKTARIYNSQVDPDISEAELTRRIEENRIVGDATAQESIDTVSSASPYIFNCSLRSTYGMGGLHANGDDATGFKSMVLAQFTGISLQKDDRAFLYNASAAPSYLDTTKSVTATDQRHTKVEAEYIDYWRHYHIKASNDAFLQVVSVFAVGYADHFVSESGSDVSITNSNSNFGNIATKTVGYKRKSFPQDSNGQIVGLIPPRGIDYSVTQPVNIGEISSRTFATWNSASASIKTKIRKIYIKNPNDPLGLYKQDEIPEYIENAGTGVEKRWLLLDGINYLLGKGKNIGYNPTTGLYETNNSENEYIYAIFPTYLGSPTQKEFKARLRQRDAVGTVALDAGTTQTTASGNITVAENSTRQFYGWEYSETIDSQYYGHIVIYVDDIADSTNYYWNQPNEGSYYDALNAASVAATGVSAVLDPTAAIDNSTQNTLLKRITFRYDSDNNYTLNSSDAREFLGASSFPSVYVKRTPDNRSQKDHIWRFLYKIPKATISKPPERKYVVKLKLDDAPYYENTFYIYDVESLVEYSYNQTDGYYLLTLTDANVKNIKGSTELLKVGYSQNQYFLYPDVDLDNPEWNPKKSTSVYDTDSRIRTITVDDTNLLTDGYDRRSEYSTTAESVEKILSYFNSGINLTSGISLYSIFSSSGSTITLQTGTNNLVSGDIIKFCSVGSATNISTDTFYKVLSSSANAITFAKLTQISASPTAITPNGSLANVKIKKINFSTTTPYKKINGSNTYNEIGIDDDIYSNAIVVSETTRNNGTAYSNRILLFENASGLSPIDIKLHRPSNIRASGHTWEYVGFGPGNYSTAFPSFQTIVLNKQQTINAQTQEQDGGFNGSSGTNSNGDFFIGSQVIDTKGSQSETVNVPKLKTSAQTRLINPLDYLYITAASSSGLGNLDAFSNILQSSARIQLAEASSKTVTYDKVTVSDIEVSNTLKIRDGAQLDIKDSKVAPPTSEFKFPVATDAKYGFSKKAAYTTAQWLTATSIDDVFVTPKGLYQWASANKVTSSPVPVPWQITVNSTTGEYNAGYTQGSSLIYNLEGGINFTFTPTSSLIDPDTQFLTIGKISQTILSNNVGVSGFIYVSSNLSGGTAIKGLNSNSLYGGNIWRSLKNAWLNTDTGDLGISGDFIINYFIYSTDRILYNVNPFD